MKAGRIDYAIAAAFCALVGLYDVIYVANLASAGIFPDFMVFHAALRAWIQGKAALIYDNDAFTAFQNALYAGRFGHDVHFRPFFYPPTWLLMLLPLAWLSLAKAYAAFMAATVAAATWLEGRRDRRGWLAILVSPAAVWTVLAGQNTFLSVALFYGGLHLLEQRPAWAGLLLGLLAYKPQLWLLVPFALVAARQWKALTWAVGTVIALALASAAFFGVAFWQAFYASLQQAGSAEVANEMYERMFMQMTTLINAARIVDLPPGIAGALQLAGSALAVAAVWVAFRHRAAGTPRTALLATATFLVSPYTLNYDLLLLMPAAVALFRVGAAAGFYPAERAIYFVLWLIPTVGMALNRHALPITPLVILLFGAVAWLRLQAAAKVELPQPATTR